MFIFWTIFKLFKIQFIFPMLWFQVTLAMISVLSSKPTLFHGLMILSFICHELVQRFPWQPFFVVCFLDEFASSSLNPLSNSITVFHNTASLLYTLWTYSSACKLLSIHRIIYSCFKGRCNDWTENKPWLCFNWKKWNNLRIENRTLNLLENFPLIHW